MGRETQCRGFTAGKFGHWPESLKPNSPTVDLQSASDRF
jgi:hypothetical protein